MKCYFAFLVLLVSIYSNSQPPNDACADAIDISNQNWFSGDNVGATRNCNEDVHFIYCNSGGPCYDPSVCGAVDGIESSVWYKFSVPSDDTVLIDFRNIVRISSDFAFGGLPSLQGFLVKKNGCSDDCTDSIIANFDFPSRANQMGAMEFFAMAGEEYYILVDSDKFSFSTCPCFPPSGTCHSNLSWEVRIRRTFVSLPLIDFTATQMKNGVQLNWFTTVEYDSFEIIRKRGNGSVVRKISLANTEANEYSFFDDTPIKEITTYLLYAGNGKSKKFLGQKTVRPEGVPIEPAIYPNPSNDVLNIEYPEKIDVIEVFSSTGKSVFRRQKVDSVVKLDVSFWKEGVYFIILHTNNSKISRKFVKSSR